MRRKSWMIFAPTYFKAYCEILTRLDEQHYPRKRRTVKKHCNRAMLEAVKLFPEFRGFERGRLAFTFVTSMMCNDCQAIVAFTAKPKQIRCASYTVKLVDMHLRRRIW